MKKLIIMISVIVLATSIFSASELDILLSEEEFILEDSVVEENGLVSKEVRVESLEGEAFVQRSGSTKWLQLIVDFPINEKDTLLTTENTSVKIKLEEEVYINVGENTRIYFDTLKGKPEMESLSETGLKLIFGKVFSNVRKKLETGGKYEIEAGSIVAGVRGTQYLANFNKMGTVNVKVYEGKVYCRFIDGQGKAVMKKKTDDAEEVSEVVLKANEEFTMQEGDTGWIKVPHSENAPLDYKKINEKNKEY